MSAYLFALHSLDLPVADARTVAPTAFVPTGLYLVVALEAGGSRRRTAAVAGMCAAMAAVYGVAVFARPTQSFFAVQAPDVGMLATFMLASVISVWALVVCGFDARSSGDAGSQPRTSSHSEAAPAEAQVQ